MVTKQSSQPIQERKRLRFRIPWLKSRSRKPLVAPDEPETTSQPTATLIPIKSFSDPTLGSTPSEHTQSQDPSGSDFQLDLPSDSTPESLETSQPTSQPVVPVASRPPSPMHKTAQSTTNMISSQEQQDPSQSSPSQPPPQSLDLPQPKFQPFSLLPKSSSKSQENILPPSPTQMPAETQSAIQADSSSARQSQADSQPLLLPPTALEPQAESKEAFKPPSQSHTNSQPDRRKYAEQPSISQTLSTFQTLPQPREMPEQPQDPQPQQETTSMEPQKQSHLHSTLHSDEVTKQPSLVSEPVEGKSASSAALATSPDLHPTPEEISPPPSPSLRNSQPQEPNKTSSDLPSPSSQTQYVPQFTTTDQHIPSPSHTLSQGPQPQEEISHEPISQPQPSNQTQTQTTNGLSMIEKQVPGPMEVGMQDSTRAPAAPPSPKPIQSPAVITEESNNGKLEIKPEETHDETSKEQLKPKNQEIAGNQTEDETRPRIDEHNAALKSEKQRRDHKATGSHAKKKEFEKQKIGEDDTASITHKRQKHKTDKNHKLIPEEDSSTICINSNTQGINNSIFCNSSYCERSPGTHLENK